MFGRLAAQKLDFRIPCLILLAVIENWALAEKALAMNLDSIDEMVKTMLQLCYCFMKIGGGHQRDVAPKQS